jgi:hypothetical protein
MHNVLMVIPSRGRPRAAEQAARTAAATAILPSTRVLVEVDGPHTRDDLQGYYDIIRDSPAQIGLSTHIVHRGMVGTLNHAAVLECGTELAAGHACTRRTHGQITHVGFMGDDHRIRTDGWDLTLAVAAGPDGIAYGDDLNMGQKLPTAVLMAADLVRIAGYMAPPELGHLYVDNYWLELGRKLGTLAYRPDVVVEHLHPSVGKGPDDEQYRRVNSPEQFKLDGDAWTAYRQAGELDRLAAHIRRHLPA